MNLPPNQLNLRELPESLVADYRTGSCTQEEKELVEQLKHLPENTGKFNASLPMIDEDSRKIRVNKLMALANSTLAKRKSGPTVRYKVDDNEEIEAAAGQLWSVKQFLGSKSGKYILPIAKPQYVFLLTNPSSLASVEEPGHGVLRKYIDDSFIEFLPVTLHTEFANQYDVKFPAGNQILGVEFMVETEINSVCLVSDLDRCFGAVSDIDAEKILNTHFFANKMGYDADLYNQTDTGTDTYSPGSIFTIFKEIEFANSQIIAEPVDALLETISTTEIITFKKIAVPLAASHLRIEIASVDPDSIILLYEDENLRISVNQYSSYGNYFVVNVAKELCMGQFTFCIENLTDTSIKLDHECPVPKEYFFPFYAGFKNGLYSFGIFCDGEEIWQHNFVIEMDLL